MTPGAHRFPLNDAALAMLVRAALDEDAADRDITTIATVRAGERTRPRLVARQAGVISGVPLALATFRALDPDVSSRVDADDGTTVAAGQDVLFISGHGRAS
jgi:nicotinate-nucleotide pyrophosphorylase (carboxylating)